MFIAGNFLLAAAGVVNIILTGLYWIILIRAVISWVNPDPYNSIVQLLNKITEPVLYPIRKILPPGFNIGIDISPLIAVLIIIFLKSFLVKTLIDLAYKLR